MTEQNNNEQKTYELVAEWLKEYHSVSDKYRKTRAKALIVTRMLPIIKKIAKTIARRSTDPIDDLVQAGAIGLLKAEINDIKAMILLAFLLLISWKSKKDPLFYILIAAIVGIFCKFL